MQLNLINLPEVFGETTNLKPVSILFSQQNDVKSYSHVIDIHVRKVKSNCATMVQQKNLCQDDQVAILFFNSP